MNNLNGLNVCNIELTSRCLKSCPMCGRRKLEKERPDLCQWGDMEFSLIEHITKQLPNNIIVQLHNSGEPTLYPRLKEALHRFKNQIRCFNTNAMHLLEKADEIIDNMESLTISVIENDLLGDEQYEIVKKFLEIKGNKKPIMIYRLLGNITKIPQPPIIKTIINDKISFSNQSYNTIPYDENREKRWYELPGIVATRMLHKPEGSFGYTKKVTIPEVGFCQDLYSHLVIDRFGDIFPCVRFDFLKINKLGNIKDMTLEEAWNGEKRQYLLKEHIKSNRKCSELCAKCQFWGIPHE